MTRVLVDSSVWISFFKGQKQSLFLLDIIDLGNLVTNDLILAELLPSIHAKGEKHLAELLLEVPKVNLIIDWPEIIRMQSENLRSGINRVGIPDLIIAQNVSQNDLTLLTHDRHFELMAPLFRLKVNKKL